MDAVIVLSAFIALAITSLLWGYDSRDLLHSKEHLLAMYGVTWTEITPGHRLPAIQDLVARQIEAILEQAEKDSLC